MYSLLQCKLLRPSFSLTRTHIYTHIRSHPRGFFLSQGAHSQPNRNHTGTTHTHNLSRCHTQGTKTLVRAELRTHTHTPAHRQRVHPLTPKLLSRTHTQAPTHTHPSHQILGTLVRARSSAHANSLPSSHAQTHPHSHTLTPAHKHTLILVVPHSIHKSLVRAFSHFQRLEQTTHTCARTHAQVVTQTQQPKSP